VFQEDIRLESVAEEQFLKWQEKWVKAKESIHLESKTEEQGRTPRETERDFTLNIH
jgi:hypothetical protein